MVAKTPLRSSSVLSMTTVRSDQSFQLRETRHRVVSFSTFIYLSPLSGHLKTKGQMNATDLSHQTLSQLLSGSLLT